jgi:flagellar motor switch protein FliM
MAELLSHDEINALIESYKATGGAEEAGKASDRRLRVYDFTRPDKFCKEHLRALNLIHGKHGASLAIALAAMLRVDVQVNLLALDQLTYREYCASVPDSTLFVEVGLEPLTSIAILEFNPSLVAACVDLLAGGSSVSDISTSRITDVDKAIMRPVIETALKKYVEAWASTVAFNTHVIATTTESTTHQILLPSEGVLVCGYEVSIADHASMMSVCIPAAAIEAVLPALALGKSVSSTVQRGGSENEALKRSFEDVEVECRAILGRTELPLTEIASLEVGDLIRLPAKVTGPTELWVENVATFAGVLGRSGRSLAVRISKALTAPRVSKQPSEGG